MQQELTRLYEYLRPTESEKAGRQQATFRVTQAIQRVFPDAQVIPFGSYYMDLYLPSSDIDLVVILHNTNQGSSEMTKEETVSALRRICKSISKAGINDRTVPLNLISKARVPIIKYTDALTGFLVDVSVNVESGLSGAKMMLQRGLTNGKHPALPILTVCIKQYLTIRGLNEVFTGGLGSFSLMCMILSFLELHPVLQLGLIKEADNIAVLYLDFLELYGRFFNYDRVGISVEKVRSGYFDRHEMVKEHPEDWQHILKQPPNIPHLSVQDPQCPTNDLARGSFQFSAVKQAFEHAFMVLTTRMRDGNDTGELLKGLVWIPEKTLRHREYINQTILPSSASHK